MADYKDVAKYILQKKGEMTAMKLQKLMYYSQAWSLVWDEKALFENDFQAWANGPVLPSLYALHKGDFSVNENLSGLSSAKIENLSENQRDSIDKVIEAYGSHTAQWLSNLTHQEAPWKDTRSENEVAPMKPSSCVISKARIHEYYSSL